MLLVSNLLIPLDYSDESLNEILSKKLRIEIDRIVNWKFEKLAVFVQKDETDEVSNVCYKANVLVNLSGDERQVLYNRIDKSVAEYEAHDKNLDEKFLSCIFDNKQNRKNVKSPVIVGSGPAGLFCAMILAQNGLNPIVIEQGKSIENRKLDVLEFWETGNLDEFSNVQFGEGGAGAFSDGKLKIGKMDAIKAKILNEFVEAGAPREILYLDKPHIGTDVLYSVVKNLREKIIKLGGKFIFECKFISINKNVESDFVLNRPNIRGIRVEDLRFNKIYEIECDNLVLAIGNSARDTFKQLHLQGMQMAPKSIGVGVRIEHSQEYINKLKYKNFAFEKVLGAADYKLVSHVSCDRSVYSFCMCPGGKVIAATSQNAQVVTNGMSNFERNFDNANSALLVSVTPKDFARDDLDMEDYALSGIYFQEEIEKKAFAAGGGNFKAPVQLLGDFLNDKISKEFKSVSPTYLPGTKFSPLSHIFPSFIVNALKEAIYDMDDYFPGFLHNEAILTAPETRSTCPIKILRDENFCSLSYQRVYPCGEGGGYSGGIISAGVDGIKCACHLLEQISTIF